MATQQPTPENAIRSSKRRETAKPAAANDTDKGSKAAKKRAATPHVPEDVRKRFVQVGAKYFFPDGARAFTDRGHRLSTPSENTEVIKSLITIAHARGWNDITVSGTERFRRDAWAQARLLGLEVRGYKPTDIENERLVRSLARRDERPTAAKRGRSAKTQAEPRAAKTKKKESGVAKESGSERSSRGTLITGRLLDHGRDTYQHKPNEAASYFIKLETARGERTVWGVDLERALKESETKPGIGEEVGLRAVREEPVTVKARRRDNEGQLEDLATHRNRWIIEQRDFFDKRAIAAQAFRDPKIDPKEGVRRHPELVSTYLHLKGAQEVATRRIRDPEDQRKFVSLVRAALADSVERGEPLQTAKLRKTPEEPAQGPRTPAREPGPSR
jgi:Large polyvalent protein-associated domain 7